MSRRPGRPPLPPEDQRAHRRTLYLSPSEAEAVARRAAAARLSVSEFVRTAALGRRLREPEVPPTNLQVIHHLARIGNNLNQAVKLVHQGRLPAGLLSLLKDLLAAIRDYRRELLGLDKDRV